MSSPAPFSTTTRSPIGSFAPDIFASHMASLPAGPAWWLERKRAAFETFASLPLPKRTDESWRFSNLAGLALDGFVLLPAEKVDIAPLAIANAASLTFVNNSLLHGANSASQLPTGVIVTTIAEAVAQHGDLLKQHFMAQPQKLGSAKFAALHTAFVREGAFIYVPRGVEVPLPIIITHAAAGPAAAVFPHTLVVLEENAKACVVDFFVSTDHAGHFACGANDLYAGHGAKLTYIAAQAWSRETRSFHFNSTVV